jgi:hypothetical protein
MIYQEITAVSNLVRSLTLTLFFSFALPIVVVSSLLTGLWLLSWIPWLTTLGQAGTLLLLQFLIIFGDGSALPGLLIIGATCSVVGGVFEVFNFYLYQDARNY